MNYTFNQIMDKINELNQIKYTQGLNQAEATVNFQSLFVAMQIPKKSLPVYSENHVDYLYVAYYNKYSDDKKERAVMKKEFIKLMLKMKNYYKTQHKCYDNEFLLNYPF
jgi:hypothetical protein